MAKTAHIDVSYSIFRAAKRNARNTGTKVVRLRLDEDGNPDGHVTLRNGRGECKGSFTVKGEAVQVHKPIVKKARKDAEAGPEADGDE